MSYETIVKVVNEFDEMVKELNFLRKRLDELESAPPNNRRKLSQQEVKDIRAAYRGGMAQVDLANNYGVNPATISRTVRGLYH